MVLPAAAGYLVMQGKDNSFTAKLHCSICLVAAGDSLQQAQLNKLDALIARADINEGHHVLEIGCGWGSMAIRCVQRTGCRVRLAGFSSTQACCCTDLKAALCLHDVQRFASPPLNSLLANARL